jgi:hypothetical protein
MVLVHWSESFPYPTLEKLPNLYVLPTYKEVSLPKKWTTNFIHTYRRGARSGTVGSSNAPQARRSWVRFTNVVIGIFHWHNPSGHTMALGLTKPLTKTSTRHISLGEGGGLLRRPVHRADNHTTFMCWLSWNLGAPTCWNPEGLSRTVKGLLYHLHI